MTNTKQCFKPVKSFSALILVIIIFAVSCSPTAKNVEINSEAFAAMERERTKAEEYVKILKQTYPVDSPEYKQGREYYIQAEAEFNGYIEELKAKLAVGQVTDLRPKVNEAVKKSEIFVQYVQSPGITQPAVKIEIITVIVDVLIDAGTKIWDQYQGVEKDQREAILKQLDGMKWKSFDEITP